MTEAHTRKIPGADHPITIDPAGATVSITSAGERVAVSDRALVLREANYPPVYYLPREDVEMRLFTRSETRSYCPYKGDCSYFTLSGANPTVEDAAWTYERPYEAVSEIAEYLSFYPNRVTITESEAGAEK